MIGTRKLGAQPVRVLQVLGRRVLGPLVGRLCRKQHGPALIAPEAANPSKFPPWPEAKTGRSAGTDADPSQQLASTALRSSPSLRRCALRLSLRGWCCCRDTTPLSQRFARATAPSSSSTERRCFQPVVVASRGDAGFHPGRCPIQQQRHATGCAAATPNSRSFWAAPACWRRRRVLPAPETYGPTCTFQAHPTPNPTRCSSDEVYPQSAGFHPGPEAGVPEQAALA